MTDLDKLKAALQRTAADGINPDRTEFFDDAGAGVARILGRIDSTVLPRRLTVTFNDGTRFHCDAASRRLVRLAAPAPDGIDPELARLFDGTVLAPADVDRIASALLGICEGRGTLTISASELDDPVDPSEGGIAPSALAETLGLDARTADQASEVDVIGTLIASIEPRLRAAFWVQDETGELLYGDGALGASIEAFTDRMMAVLLSPSFPLASTLETDGIVTFGLGPDSETHALIAGRLGQYVVALVDGRDQGPSLNAWRHANGR